MPLRHLCVCVAVLLLACGSDSSSRGDASDGGADAGAATNDAGASTSDAGQSPTDAGVDAGEATSDSGGTGLTTGTIQGTVSWDATEPPGWTGDGAGDLVVALFPTDPATSIVGLPVAFQQIADVGVRAMPVRFELSDVPPRSEPYFLSAFLDDDENAGLIPSPGRFDAVATESGMMATPQVSVPMPGIVSFDLVLNVILTADP